MELVVVPLRAIRETERAVVVPGIGGGVEATCTSLADRTEQRAVVHFYHLCFVASDNHRRLAEVPGSTVVGGIEQVVVCSSTPISAVGDGVVAGCQSLCRDEVHQYAVGGVETLAGSDEVVVETVTAGSTNTCGVLNGTSRVEIDGRIALAAAPRHTIVCAGGHADMLLAIPIAEVACSEETVEFAVLTLHETWVTEATPVIVGST